MSFKAALSLVNSPTLCQVWRPDKGEEVYDGVLTLISGERPALETNVEVVPGPRVWPGSIDGVLLHGRARGGRIFTFFGTDGRHFGDNGQVHRADVCFVGAHVETTELSNIRFSSTQLGGFIGPPLQSSWESVNVRSSQVSHTCTFQDSIAIFGYEYVTNDWRLMTRAEVRVRRALSRDVHWWFDNWVDPLNRLASFAARRPSEVALVYTELDDREVLVFANGITCELDSVADVEVKARLAAPQAPAFWRVWKPWVTRTDSLDLAVDLMLETINRRHVLSPRHRFLNLVQAAEAVHSTVYRATKMPPGKYRARQQAVKRLIKRSQLHGTAVAKFVNSHLQGAIGNSIALESRLKDLVGDCDDQYKPKAKQPLWTSNKHWHQWVANARNGISHGSTDIDGHWLNSVSADLERLLDWHVFRSLGYSHKQARHIMRNRRY